MVKTYQANGFARPPFRAVLNELLDTGQIKSYRESRGFLISYFTVSAPEEIHNRIEFSIRSIFS